MGAALSRAAYLLSNETALARVLSASRALTDAQVSEETMQDLWTVLAALLRMGNLTFSETKPGKKAFG